jgi:predicted nucleic acid-binding protein
VKPVFLDTVGLIALWDRTDQWHVAASTAYASLKENRGDVSSTTFVLAECGNAAARRPYRPYVWRLRAKLEKARKLITPTDKDWKKAWDAYERKEFGDAGLVDCISIVVGKRLGITQVFTNDRHFSAAGFEVLF